MTESYNESHSANQDKAEPFPPSPSQADQETPGQQHPQGPGAAVPFSDTDDAPATSETFKPSSPGHVPQIDQSGQSDR